MAEAQRTINLSTGQISHGYVDKPASGNAKVVVGYAPSMIRVFLEGASNAITSRLYWYATNPDKAVKMVDSAEGSGCAVIASPLVVNERGFEVKAASLSGVERVIWEVFGCEDSGSVDPDEGDIYSMPAALVEEETPPNGD